VGVAARRACDELIASGKVRVNGRTVRAPGARIVPGEDRVSLDGQALDRPPHPIVLLLHKPSGVVSTASDPQGRTTVVDLCRQYRRGRRLFPVGRLDVTTTGALLLTNDGDLCYRLTHPRYELARVYQVRARGHLTERTLSRMDRMAREGDPASRGRGARARAPERTGAGGARLVKELGRESIIRVTLLEGRNRQVRRICEAVGLRVVKLKRLSFGPVTVRGLPEGAVRPLEKRELEKLRAVME